jgi:hypothetical protein
VHSALTSLLLEYLKGVVEEERLPAVVLDEKSAEMLSGSVTDSCVNELQLLFNSTLENKITINEQNVLECNSLQLVREKLDTLTCMLSDRCRTARLWVSYLKYVDVVRTFITAERTSDWLLHLQTLESMLPLFAATAHSNYAKSACVYLQEMQDLDIMLWEDDIDYI